MKATCSIRLIDHNGARVFGAGPYRLLALLDELGSLSAAAREFGMSYSKAVRIINNAERAMGFKLTSRQAGGKDGGRTQLTSQGRDLLGRYVAWERAMNEAADRTFASCFAGICGQAPYACCVLAAGRAERFGAQKLLEPLDGVPVLEHTLKALSQADLNIFVVAAPGPVADFAQSLGYPTVEPTGPLQSDSLRAGLAAVASYAACLFVPGDQPLISSASVADLVRSAERNPGVPVRLAWHGEPASPVFFPQALFGPLAALTGDKGGVALLEARPDLAAQTVLVEARDATELKDVDTPFALAELEQALLGQEV